MRRLGGAAASVGLLTTVLMYNGSLLCGFNVPIEGLIKL